jgi:hypothetical protein
MTAALRSSDRNPFPPARRNVYSGESKVTPFAPPQQTRRERQQLARRQGSPLAPVSPAVVRSLPANAPKPLWLLWLIVAHRGSSAIALLLVAAALTVYGWTVHTQQVWGQEYHRLRNLQQQERQLTVANEALKNDLAQQAEAPTSPLRPPSPGDTIFLAPAPVRAASVVLPTAEVEPTISSQPLGY